MHNHRKHANAMPLDASTSAAERVAARRDERLRPVHYLAHLKVSGGPGCRCYLYICPLSCRVLSYRLEPEH